ncbi:hypothetical protein CcaverHIS002_0408100 [Cutaneotrichosporon cavernicola]|uniref:F-box domain-containing protein n=1 Tax=Cutaneotrichosporon cavernicola TaxID=279322 RepID=A0AA48L4W5_9TREE|nr:uncharacterized protein CcaverHIS019_0408080 [Cutaneotrichosporon cavernicola]BEI84206.1 hypothetical protein CcaverHIS002_0408100 [Cutaneotrichosporon cavernicola]BEI91988.1 hypothetical protein CcaverHIS019_0408080 [Cutaneotrichosporon cavernicola]BEI99759.1 hypothetical protein CcaverHIS631_0408020 [Cutaneotrichosporon cavernicola]BEJ07535.1 hypothetical protein CcaverHIS641_0408040 [Cutaneotrichosporon cavernicola]
MVEALFRVFIERRIGLMDSVSAKKPLPSPPAVHCPYPTANAPTFQSHPNHPLSASYPHISETIIKYLPHTTRLALRSTCKALGHAVDVIFVRSLTLESSGLRCPSGRVPIRDLTARPELHRFVRALDFSPLIESHSLIESAFALIPQPSTLPGLQIVRSSAERALARAETAPTIVRVFEATVSNPGGWWTPWRLQARPLPRCERLVLLILYHVELDIRSAQLSPRFWTFPPSVKEVVLHVRPHPNPPKGLVVSRAQPDNGFERWARLLGMLSVLAASKVPRVVLVGTQEWDSAWIMVPHTENKGFEEAWKGAYVAQKVCGGMDEETAKVEMEERFRFPTEEEYRVEVGQRAWAVETAASLADLEEGVL